MLITNIFVEGSRYAEVIVTPELPGKLIQELKSLDWLLRELRGWAGSIL